MQHIFIGKFDSNFVSGKINIKTNAFRYTKPQIDHESMKKHYGMIRE